MCILAPAPPAHFPKKSPRVYLSCTATGQSGTNSGRCTLRDGGTSGVTGSDLTCTPAHVAHPTLRLHMVRSTLRSIAKTSEMLCLGPESISKCAALVSVQLTRAEVHAGSGGFYGIRTTFTASCRCLLRGREGHMCTVEQWRR